MVINKNLLKQLYQIEHPSSCENEMTSFILNYCFKIPNIRIFIDHYNNLFITKNTDNPKVYPCLIAHQDEVLKAKFGKKVIEKLPFIYGQCPKNKKQVALGADDANGIYIILHLLEILPNLKCIFTVEEELGCRGAEQAVFNIGFFRDVQYFIQADRKGSSDLITHSNGVTITSKDFLKDIKTIRKKYHYNVERGLYTDVGVFVDEINLAGINVSCGYYNEHTSYEKCNIRELENCLNFIYDIIIELKDKVYPHSTTSRHYYNKYPKDYDYTYGVSSYDLPYDSSLPCDVCETGDCMNCTILSAY